MWGRETETTAGAGIVRPSQLLVRNYAMQIETCIHICVGRAEIIQRIDGLPQRNLSEVLSRLALRFGSTRFWLTLRPPATLPNRRSASLRAKSLVRVRYRNRKEVTTSWIFTQPILRINSKL